MVQFVRSRAETARLIVVEALFWLKQQVLPKLVLLVIGNFKLIIL